MESSEKLEQIDEAIKKLLAEKRNKKQDDSVHAIFHEDNNDHHLLNKLLSELEVLKGGSKVKESEDNGGIGSSNENEIVAKEIVKELKYVKRQNIVTHCLLSALIVITVAWQLSEVSLILKLKDGFSHPFKSLGSAFAGMIKLPGTNGKDAQKEEDSEASPPLPLPDLGLHGDKQ